MRKIDAADAPISLNKKRPTSAASMAGDFLLSPSELLVEAVKKCITLKAIAGRDYYLAHELHNSLPVDEQGRKQTIRFCRTLITVGKH